MELNTLKTNWSAAHWTTRFRRVYAAEPAELAIGSNAFGVVCSDRFQADFGGEEAGLFSAPDAPRWAADNYTDHQRGHVLAGSVNLDMAACAGRNGLRIIRVLSDGYPQLELDSAPSPDPPAEKGTSAALVRGVCRAMRDRGYVIEGWDACITSNVPGGSGLSSSAAYEILVGTIVNHLFCNDELTPVELAQIGQYAENVFFGKPSGLMDQMASSLGNVVDIDFADPAHPVVQPVNFDMAASWYAPVHR